MAKRQGVACYVVLTFRNFKTMKEDIYLSHFDLFEEYHKTFWRRKKKPHNSKTLCQYGTYQKEKDKWPRIAIRYFFFNFFSFFCELFCLPKHYVRKSERRVTLSCEVRVTRNFIFPSLSSFSVSRFRNHSFYSHLVSYLLFPFTFRYIINEIH